MSKLKTVVIDLCRLLEKSQLNSDGNIGEKSKNLIQFFKKMKKSAQFEHQAPNMSVVVPGYTRTMIKDYHLKSSAPGYTRNEFGRPFFS